MICKYCGFRMILDDVDFNFPGNQDNYWLCLCCHVSVIEKIRFGKTFEIKYFRGDDELRC